MPLGFEDRRLPNPVIRASSYYNYYCGPWNARLNQRRAGRNGGAWCAKKRDRGQWLQMDFGGLTRVTRIATQGRQNSDQWVTSYYVSYSRKGRRFIPYREKGRTKVGCCERKKRKEVRKVNNWHFKRWNYQSVCVWEEEGCVRACVRALGISQCG